MNSELDMIKNLIINMKNSILAMESVVKMMENNNNGNGGNDDGLYHEPLVTQFLPFNSYTLQKPAAAAEVDTIPGNYWNNGPINNKSVDETFHMDLHNPNFGGDIDFGEALQNNQTEEPQQVATMPEQVQPQGQTQGQPQGLDSILSNADFDAIEQLINDNAEGMYCTNHSGLCRCVKSINGNVHNHGNLVYTDNKYDNNYDVNGGNNDTRDVEILPADAHEPNGYTLYDYETSVDDTFFVSTN